MGPKLFTAIRLYVDGVRDGHLGVALDKYVAAEPVRAALARRFQPLVSAHDRRAVIPLRGFEDGSQVFLHTLQNFGLREVEQVGIDIFDLDDDDHIVGYRTAIMPLAGPTMSGRSQIDGPTHVEDADATAANKALVRAYAREVLLGGHLDRASRWICPRTFIQHDPDIPAGLDGYLHYLGDMAAAGAPIRYTAIDAVAASGNLVATIGRATIGATTIGTAATGTATTGTAPTGTATAGTPTAGTATNRSATTGAATNRSATTGAATTGTAIVGTPTVGAASYVVADLYRIAAGSIVEHWNVREPVPMAP